MINDGGKINQWVTTRVIYRNQSAACISMTASNIPQLTVAPGPAVIQQRDPLYVA